MEIGLTEIFLAIAGIILQLVVRYVPKVWAWFSALQNKGLVMLGLVVLISASYLGLACSPWAGILKITLQCNEVGVFEVIKTIFAIAIGNQLTYLYTRG